MCDPQHQHSRHYVYILLEKSHKQLIIGEKQLGVGWLTPVILATWEAEIGRIKIQGQSRQIVLETLFPK
jgi:hypothetical protein